MAQVNNALSLRAQCLRCCGRSRRDDDQPAGDIGAGDLVERYMQRPE